MVLSEVPEPKTGAPRIHGSATRLLIAVPFYRNERLVHSFTAALLRCADEVEELGARVVFFDDSPDYPALAQAMDEATSAGRDTLDIEVRRNSHNLGWLKTSNLAMQAALDLDVDLILFNSDTMIFPGALKEMVRVARLDPMIGFVNPRSNNATLASFPVGEQFRTAEPETAAATHRALAHLLPEVSYVPTAIGFAVLVRKTILSEFGFFDEAYGGGYNEENDLVMRATRCGYRAVLANRAFVWHQGEQSFEGDARKSVVEEQNQALLDRRYPEYLPLVRAWFDGVEHRGEMLLSQLAPDAKGRRRVAFDFSTFGPYHSGTQKAGVQLAAVAARDWGDAFDVYVMCTPAAFEFHELGAFGVQRCDPHGPELFAVIFRVGQPFDWDTMRRLALKAAVVGIFMLDTISIDCSHLYNPHVVNIWHSALTSSDFIIYNSAFTARQFELRFPYAIPPRQSVSLHSLDYSDYQAPPSQNTSEVSAEISSLADDYILVFGNQYPHKAVGHVANLLARTFPTTHFVALGVTADGIAIAGSPSGQRHKAGQQDDKLDVRDNLRGFRVGHLSDPDIDALQQKAKLIIMPSHYEGFGLPVVHALALGKPVLVRRLPPLVEIYEGLGRPANIHFFDSTAELLQIMENPPRWRATPQAAKLTGDADRAARDVRVQIEHAIGEARYDRIVARFREIHALYGVANHAGMSVPSSPPEFAARRMALASERIFRRLFQFPGVFKITRIAYRLFDTIRRR